MSSEIIVKNKNSKERVSFQQQSIATEVPDSRSDGIQVQQIEGKRDADPDQEVLTTLYSLVKAKNWELVIKRCSGPDRKEAGFWVVQKDGDFEWKSLPIHLACELQAPFAVIKALLDSFEPAVRMRDYLCRLPLHIACLCRASSDVIALLLDAYPDATRIPDDAGCIPLHYACRKGIHEKVIQRLLFLNHSGAYSTDSFSLLPIHWACKYSSSLAVVECLLRAHPHSVDCLDQYGRCPMDVAKQTPNYADKAAVLDALGRNAAYWTMGLVHVVEILKKDIGQLENTMKQSSACRDDEIDRLQQILGQVTKANAEAAKNMKHAKSELEYENTCLKNQLKKLTQENMMYEERIETLTTDNNHLNKDLDLLQENLKNENTALKQDVKKLREDAFSYKKQMIELFDDNVRLTHEVNRLTERLDQITQNMKGDGLDRNGNTNIGDIFHCG